MVYSLALAVWPISLTKVVVCTLALMIWAKWSSVVDKDSAYYRLRHRIWNAINVAAAGVGFAFVFLVPLFIIGAPLMILTIGSAMTAYFRIRNKNVPVKARWQFDLDTMRKLMIERRQARAEKSASIKFKSAPGVPKDLKPVPLPDEERYEPHMRLEEILDGALQRHAQGVDFTGGDTGYQVTLQIDGVEYKQSKLPTEEALPTIDYLRLHAGHNIADRRKLQTGACKIESQTQGAHDLKVMSSGSTRGFQCTVSIDPVKQVSIPLNELGLLDVQMKQLEPVLLESRGLVLVATPPKQGRTATLYAFTANHDPYTMDIQVIEQEKERDLDAVTESTVPAEETANKIRSILLRDPHVLMVAAVTDQPTARQLAEGSAEGKRVYAGLRAEDTLSALKLWVKAVGDRQIVQA